MRLAVYHNLPSGGAKKFLWGFFSQFSRRHEVDLYRVLGFDNESFCDLRPYARQVYEYEPGAAPLRVQRAVLGRAWAELAKTETAMAADIDRRGYDAVFVHHCQVTTSPFLLSVVRTPSLYYLQEPRRALFEHAHRASLAIDVRRPTAAAKALRRRLVLPSIELRDARNVQRATMVACNSYYSLESIYRAYGRYARVSYLGIDEGTFVAGASDRHEGGVLCVGAVVPSKGQLLVLDAVGRLPAEARPTIHLAYDRYDEGYLEKVQRRASRLGLDLSLRRRISEEELVELYRSSTVTVCVSQLEPFGLTALESMACGTPVVAVREGGFRESVVDGVNGILVDRDASALGKAIRRVLAGEFARDPAALRGSILPRFSLGEAVKRLEAQLAVLAATEGGAGGSSESTP